MIRNDEELAVQQELLRIVEGIVESWRKELLPHNPKNFALYAEGAIDQAELLRAEIDEYLARKDGAPAATNGMQSPTSQQPAKAS